jgi:biotin carboxyl carrier protein
MNKINAKVGDERFQLDFVGILPVLLNETKISPDIKVISDNEVSVIYNGKSYYVLIVTQRNNHVVYINNQRFCTSIVSTAEEFIQKYLVKDESIGAKIDIRAPMPGLVSKIEVKEGDTVEKGTGLVILEAMKMENELKADRYGLIKKIFVKEKQTVEKDQLLITLER